MPPYFPGPCSPSVADRMRRQLKLHLIVLAASFLSVFLTFQLALEYALGSDSWLFLVYPEKLVYQHSLTARPVLAGLQWLMNRAGWNIVALQFWDALFGMVVLALAMVWLQDALLKDRPASLQTRVLAFLISFALVCNPLMTEWFGNSFIIPPTCLSELLCVGAAILLAQKQMRPLKLLAIFAMAITASGLFQSPMSLIVPIAMALLALDDAGWPKIVRRAGFGMAAWACGGLSGYLYARYVHPLFFRGELDRRVSAFHPLANLKLVLADSKDIWIDSFALIPKYAFVSILLAALVLTVMLRVPRRLKLLAVASAGVLIALTLGLHLVVGGVWIVPRSVTSLCAAIGILLIPALRQVHSRPALPVALPMAIVLSALWFGICAMASTRALSDYHTNYYLDSLEAKLIYRQITNCERQSGNRIDRVAFKLDRYPWWCYETLRCSGDFNVRAWTKSFARQPMMRLTSGRNFEEVTFTQSVRDVFGTDNWDEFSPDQVKCMGNTAYIGIY